MRHPIDPAMRLVMMLLQGLTVSVDEHGKVIVARILSNSYIESQGLLRPGDIILEANGTRVTNPEQVREGEGDTVS